MIASGIVEALARIDRLPPPPRLPVIAARDRYWLGSDADIAEHLAAHEHARLPVTVAPTRRGL